MDTFWIRRISAEIEYRLVELTSATDILRFSFVVQNSISPLDLSQQEERIFNNLVFLRGFRNSSILDSTIRYPKYIINTEEKCRKILSPAREFLYRLHLDLPRNRECSLKDGAKPENMYIDCRRRHIGEITVHPNFHFTMLSSLLKEAVKRSDKKLNMIKWFVNFGAMAEDVCLDIQHVFYFAKYMYSEIIESAFVKTFLKKVDLFLWIRHNDRPEILEFFLYHLRQNGDTFTHNIVCPFEPIEVCIDSLCFLNIATILKYQDAPRVPPLDIVWQVYMRIYRNEVQGHVLLEAEKRMSPKRFYLMSQFLYILGHSPTPSAAECLRLLWNSLPDAFLSFEEFVLALGAGVSSEIIRELYTLYSKAVGVGVFHERVEPRSLKQIFRTIVRRMLWDSGCWIPDGIKLIGVPKQLKSFLNLEA